MKLLFWLFVGLDVVALLIAGALGLAAAGPSRTGPLAALVVPVLVPGVILLGAVALFHFGQGPTARLAALLVAALPFLFVVGGRLLTQWQLGGYRDTFGEVRQFRSDELRALEDAVQRGDAAAVAALAPRVDVNTPGLSGATVLVLALRQMQKGPAAPGATEVVRALLAAGADPNVDSVELPLQCAIAATRNAGLEPLRLLLDAGADPNGRTEYDDPVFFFGGGAGVDVRVMELLLDHGADVQLRGKDGKSAAVLPTITRNWRVLELLLRRGAPWRDQQGVGGVPLRTYIEQELNGKTEDGAAEVLALLR